MDVLSDVLQVIRLSGGMLFRASFGAPWAIITSGAQNVMRQFPGSVRRVIVFHVVVHGTCWVRCAPGSPRQLTPGEAVVLPRCDVHVLGDEPDRTPVTTESLLKGTPLRELREISYGGSGRATEILCGFLSCDQSDFAPLFAALPPLFCVPLHGSGKLPALNSLLDYAVREVVSDAEGAASARLRVAELLFVETLRRYMAMLPADEVGWLAGLRDPVVGRALGLMHADPCHPWTVSELAAQAAVSRSSLATRFSQLLGEPPMQYLARWRLLLAARHLGDGERSIAMVAESVGYDSPAAFQRAFKRLRGETPAAFRKRLRTN